MATVVVSWTTREQEFPGVVVPGNYRVRIVPGGFADQLVAESPATFNDIPPGSYIASVVRLDSAGEEIGDSVSQPFIVPAVSTMVNVPVEVEVNVS